MQGSLEASPFAGHTVRFYDGAGEIGDILARYVLAGLDLGEHVVVAATAEHRAAVDAALVDAGVDTVREDSAGRYVSLDAEAVLSTFMVGGSPDRSRFTARVGGILGTAGADGSHVRVFGEMVALLWEQGNVAAAMTLESLWNALTAYQEFSLLCAYPVSVLPASRLGDIDGMCQLHGAVQPPSSYHELPSAAGDIGDRQCSQVFVPAREAVPAVRRFVADVLHAWGARRLTADAALVASELATNAVVHARSPFRAFVHRTETTVLIGIKDVSQGRAVRHAPRRDALSGRGVAIVEAVSQRWGVDVLPDGKFVWAEFATEPAVPPGPPVVRHVCAQ